MERSNARMKLAAVVLADTDIEVTYSQERGIQNVHRPEWIRLAPDGMFLHWPDAPEVKQLRVEWVDNPVVAGSFTRECVVVSRQEDGLLAEFEGPAPVALQDWFERLAGLLDERVPDAAVKTSRLYTNATVVSATGLFCGALAILLPILAGDQLWVDLASKALLLAMVLSIALFAWLRALAGRAEVRAIGQGQG